MSDLKRTTLAIEGPLLEQFDQWMRARGYTNRSEAVRDLMRSALVAESWSDPDAQVAGAVCIIYDHEAHTLAQELTHMQHEDHHAVLCSQHVHLDHHNCMETILLKGPAGRVRTLADAIIATRGVRAGKLTMMNPEL